jgi:hypothetical protein
VSGNRTASVRNKGISAFSYPPRIVLIQVTWHAGRSIEVKKSFYRAVANGIQIPDGFKARQGVPFLRDSK